MNLSISTPRALPVPVTRSSSNTRKLNFSTSPSRWASMSTLTMQRRPSALKPTLRVTRWPYPTSEGVISSSKSQAGINCSYEAMLDGKTRHSRTSLRLRSIAVILIMRDAWKQISTTRIDYRRPKLILAHPRTRNSLKILIRSL